VDEATSARVARRLRAAGWPKARALVGGWRAWRDAGLPVKARDPAGVAR
jgi:3-mercaptopyruvate sulfurtransferase SseA